MYQITQGNRCRSLTACWPILFTLLSSCAAYTTSTSTNADTVQQLSTPAGHQFWYYPMPESERTAVAITWHSDLPDVTTGREATPRVGIELMLNGGAGNLAAEEIIADFEDLDAGSRLWVQPQEISGFVVSPVEHLNKASEIANLVLTQPNLEQKWFDREHKSLVDQAAERESVVFGLAWNLSREVILTDHAYKRFWSLLPLDGIKKIELNDVKNWHSNAFSTAAMSITVAGNADSDAVGASIDRVLDGMTDRKPAPMRVFPKPAIPGKTILLHKPDATKSAILIIGNLPSHTEGKDIPMQLGLGVLGYGKQSRLFKAVRSGLRAAYGFGAGTFDMTREHTIVHISGEVETAKLQEALNETNVTYEEFRQKGIGRLEFPIAKKFYLQRVREEISKPSSVAYMLMQAKLNESGTQHVPTLIAQIDEQKRSSVNAVISDSLPEFESMLKLIVTPDASAIKDACVITEIEQWQNCE